MKIFQAKKLESLSFYQIVNKIAIININSWIFNEDTHILGLNKADKSFIVLKPVHLRLNVRI